MRIRTGTWAAVAAMLLAFVPVGAYATPLVTPGAPGGAPSGAPGTNQGQGAENRSAQADAALDKAAALFETRRGALRKRGGDASGRAGHATLVLRDLALRVGDLDGRDRETALRILARPTDGAQEPVSGVKYGAAPSTDTCSVTGSTDLEVCLHWVTDPSDNHAPDPTDGDSDGLPDWVETNQQVFAEVWQRIIGDLGYRGPVDDSTTENPGPDGRTDVYLADLGPHQLFGYCVAEWVDGRARSFPSYCVVDDDFAAVQYGGADPLESLRVTAAHEFFHAVQFGYNVWTDAWLAEGTALWIEDEVYDDVDAYVGYLAESPLASPGAPLDAAPAEGAWVYGSSIWWRYLAELYGPRRTSDPTIVRDVWDRLAGGQGSLAGTRSAISGRGDDFGRVFADFGATNRIAKRWYEEGTSYMNAPVAGRFRVSRSRQAIGWREGRLNHLTNMHAVVRPGRGLAGRWKLRFDLDLPARLRGSQATVVVQRRDGGQRWYRPKLDRRGDAAVAVPFDKRVIGSATLTFTNASTRIGSCGSGTIWACEGVPRDEDLSFLFRARVLKR